MDETYPPMMIQREEALADCTRRNAHGRFAGGYAQEQGAVCNRTSPHPPNLHDLGAGSHWLDGFALPFDMVIVLNEQCNWRASSLAAHHAAENLHGVFRSSCVRLNLYPRWRRASLC